jgi:hypothetical protein
MNTKELMKWLPCNDSGRPGIHNILKTEAEEWELDPEIENIPKELEDPYQRMFLLKPRSDTSCFVGNEYFIG